MAEASKGPGILEKLREQYKSLGARIKKLMSESDPDETAINLLKSEQKDILKKRNKITEKKTWGENYLKGLEKRRENFGKFNDLKEKQK